VQDDKILSLFVGYKLCRPESDVKLRTRWLILVYTISDFFWLEISYIEWLLYKHNEISYPYHIMSCHIVSYRIVSYHIPVSYTGNIISYIVSYHIVSYRIYHIISYHIISYWYHII